MDCPTAEACKSARASDEFDENTGGSQARARVMQEDEWDWTTENWDCGDMPDRPPAASDDSPGCMNWDAYFYESTDENCNTMWENWDEYCLC